jgi:hypothetical protein
MDQARTQFSTLCGMYLPANYHTTVNIHDHIQKKVHAADFRRQPRVSNPEESHLQVLSEPGVNLSAHRVPTIPVYGKKPVSQCGNNHG